MYLCMCACMCFLLFQILIRDKEKDKLLSPNVNSFHNDTKYFKKMKCKSPSFIINPCNWCEIQWSHREKSLVSSEWFQQKIPCSELLDKTSNKYSEVDWTNQDNVLHGMQMKSLCITSQNTEIKRTAENELKFQILLDFFFLFLLSNNETPKAAVFERSPVKLSILLQDVCVC